MKRDTQKYRAYDAEHSWVERLKESGGRRQFIDPAHMDAYVRTVWLWARQNLESLGLDWRYVREPYIVQRQRGLKSTAFTDGKIWLASGTKQRAYHWTDHLLLHEMAHIWLPDDVRHGREWAALYLRLVSRWMGSEAAKMLREEFRRQRVKFTAKRVLSDERKAELVARMHRVRQANLTRTEGL